MSRYPLKTLAVATALSLAYQSPAFSQPAGPQKPCSYSGLIQLNQQVYYSGDRLEMSLVIPEELKALLKEEAEAHLLVHFPQGEIAAFPVVEEGPFLEATVEAEALAAGDYQLALVFTQRGGEAVKLADWYNGFAGLVSFNRLKLSEALPGSEAEDLDADGVTNREGFSNSEVVGTGTVCAEAGALKPATDVAAESVRAKTLQTDYNVKPAVSEAMQLLYRLKFATGEYLADRGEFPTALKEITDVTDMSNQSVAHISLTKSEEFYYQLTLKSESEGVEQILAGKTVRFTYDPITNRWHCRPGNPKGLDKQYLPLGCR
jgi:hypothetical protein